VVQNKFYNVTRMFNFVHKSAAHFAFCTNFLFNPRIGVWYENGCIDPELYNFEFGTCNIYINLHIALHYILLNSFNWNPFICIIENYDRRSLKSDSLNSSLREFFFFSSSYFSEVHAPPRDWPPDGSQLIMNKWVCVTAVRWHRSSCRPNLLIRGWQKLSDKVARMNNGRGAGRWRHRLW